MVALYELAGQVKQLLELDGLDQQSIDDTLEGMGFEDKVSGCVALVKQLEADADMLKGEADKLSARAKTAQAKADRLTDYVLQNMQLAGIKKAGTTLHQAIVTKAPKAVNIASIDTLPSEFVKVKTEYQPDKKAILAAIEAGQVFDGVTVTQREYLRIK